MKKYMFGLLLVSGLILGACGNSEATKTEETKGGESSESNVLVVSTFRLSEDIVKQDIMAPFEKANDAKITLEVGNSADRFTKLKNNPNAGVDIIDFSTKELNRR